MTSEARIAANRRNAAKSTGPKTAAGKAASSRNALRHGLTAEQVVMFDESADDFAAFQEEMRAALDPADAVEEMLAERIVLCAWRLRRAARTEADLYQAMSRREGNWHCEHLGEAFEACGFRLANLSRYETALDRALAKAYATLERRQAQRRGEKATSPGKGSVDAEKIAERVAEILLEADQYIGGDDDPPLTTEELNAAADQGHPACFYETNPMTARSLKEHPMRDVPFYGTNPFKAAAAPLAQSDTASEAVRESGMLPK
jgi:hypothetical protein